MKKLHLNLGCGKKILKSSDLVEWINIDLKCGDVQCDIRSLPYLDDVADEIVAIHVVEHFFITEVLAVLKEWHRVLKPEGVLVIELPCWDKVRELVKRNAPDNFTRWAMFGDPSTHVDGVPALHKWCWSVAEMEDLLQEAGFVNVKLETPLFHQPIRDMRFVACK